MHIIFKCITFGLIKVFFRMIFIILFLVSSVLAAPKSFLVETEDQVSQAQDKSDAFGDVSLGGKLRKLWSVGKRCLHQKALFKPSKRLRKTFQHL